MKTSGSMIGGTLNSADYQVFANYLVKFIQAYDAAGVPISLITAQNEPEYSPSNYPGSTFTSTQEANFIANNLGPAIRAAGLTTGILGYDHNWNDPSFPETILGDSSAAQYVTGTAWHCYAGDPSAQSTVEALYPSYGTYETECSGSQSSPVSDTFADTLDWELENLVVDGIRNYSKSVVTWNMALNPSGGPSMNCTTCTALVTVNNSADTATYNAEYYSLGQVSKFVKPGCGAHRLQHLRLGQRRGRRLPEPRRLRRAGGTELQHLRARTPSGWMRTASTSTTPCPPGPSPRSLDPRFHQHRRRHQLEHVVRGRQQQQRRLRGRHQRQHR